MESDRKRKKEGEPIDKILKILETNSLQHMDLI